MSQVYSYLKRNKHKYLIDSCNNFIYVFAKEKNVLNNYFDFKICLTTKLCNLITQDNVYDISLSDDDFEQLLRIA